jgi:DNA (cytosine-5)-methyltransferase 1
VRPDLVLCGQMFGLELYRHRLFESNTFLWQPEHPKHVSQPAAPATGSPGTVMSVSGHVSPMWKAREVMGGIDWMNRAELAESIPPAYTEHIGRQLLAHLDRSAAA